METKGLLVTLSVVVGFALRMAAEPTEAQLMKEAKITKNEAEHLALAKVPNGRIEGAELEREHGKLIWSFDIAQADTKNITEVQVDAKTGKIASLQVESPKDQASEVAAEKPKK